MGRSPTVYPSNGYGLTRRQKQEVVAAANVVIKELQEIQAPLQDQRTVAVRAADGRDGADRLPLPGVAHLCDQQEAEEEADRTEAQEQQFSAVTLPEHSGKHVGHRRHQALQTHKL